MSGKPVFIKKIKSPHQEKSFKHFMPLAEEMVLEINKAVEEIFNSFGGSSMIKSSGDVYIKPNGIDAKPYCYTRPEVVEAVIRYWFAVGAKNVYLFENSTQSNYTRLVFENNGYKKICKQTGAKPIYLDEEKTVEFKFDGKEIISGNNPDGYELPSFKMPQTVVEKLIEGKEENLYVNLPKLKTHSMSGVTLGIKNQWGFPGHACRGIDHNYNLHYKLVDVLSYIQPDFTLIEGIEGTVYGHYPVTAFADNSIKPFKILIGSANVFAADMAGAKIFGLDIDDVPHLKITRDKNLSGGINSLKDIELQGDIDTLEGIDLLGDMPESGKYPTDLYDSYPGDVNIFKGKTRACKEGCVNNPLTLLQILFYD
ncbi:MAG: DUF362 domain-containing protein, partial [bacterium]|nr:DUF362 domain-containing protein [bacterium]